MKPANFAPVYACLYPQLAEIARNHGYCLAVHGSMARDFDLICVPWVAEPSEPQAVVDEFCSTFAMKEVGGPAEIREHHRLIYTLAVKFGECFIDLSFMLTKKQRDKVDRKKFAEAFKAMAKEMSYGIFNEAKLLDVVLIESRRSITEREFT